MPMSHHSRTVGLGLLGTLALAGVLVLGSLVSLLPASGLHCPLAQARVVLDPGHGGDDPGATNNAAGLVERDATLDIAFRTRAILQEKGYSVALTRSDNATGYTNTPRGAIANDCQASAYVSIHLNSFGEPDPNYAKTFWGVASKDAAFARIMQAALVSHLRPGTGLGDSGLEQLENGGLLTARMPAILVEPVFLSNPAEAARLTEPEGTRRAAIAQAVADGVDVWLRSRRISPINDVRDRSWFTMTPGDPLRAPSRGSAMQALAAATRAGAERPDDLWAYVAEVYRLAPLVGLDPAVVIAQSALETGWWTSPAWRKHLNPAGIGVTGADVESATWATGEDAARAQLVHLALYAAGPIRAGDPLASYVSLDPRYEAAVAAGRAGSARTISDLAGRWATDPDYARGIARVGNSIFAEP